MRLTVGKFSNFLQNIACNRLNMVKTFSRAFLGECKHHLLSAVENYLGVILFGESFAGDLVAGTNECADNRFIFNNLYVFLKVREMRQTVCQVSDRRNAADSLDGSVL